MFIYARTPLDPFMCANFMCTETSKHIIEFNSQTKIPLCGGCLGQLIMELSHITIPQLTSAE